MTDQPIAVVSPRGSKITWYCGKCFRPIAPRAGYVEVDHYKAVQVRQAEDHFRREHNGVYSMDEWFDQVPERAQWVAWHRQCDPDPDKGGTYWIEIGRIDTTTKLIHWAGHLLEKRWISATDFSTLLQTVGQYA